MMSCSRRPIWPAAIRSRISAKVGSNRRLNPTITVESRPLMSSQHASTRARSRSIGFSQSTALPARTEAVSRSTWVAVGEAMMTAPMLSSPRITSASWAGVAPYRVATSSAAASTGSCTTASSVCGWAASEAAWTWPILPAPNRPKRSIVPPLVCLRNVIGASGDLDIDGIVDDPGRVRAHADKNRSAERLAAGVVEPPVVLGALDDAAHDQAVAQQRLLVRAVAVGGVVRVVRRPVDRVVAAVVLERDDVLGVDAVRLAGGDPLGHRCLLGCGRGGQRQRTAVVE